MHAAPARRVLRKGLMERCDFFHDVHDGGKSSGIMATNLRPQRISDDIVRYLRISYDIDDASDYISRIFECT